MPVTCVIASSVAPDRLANSDGVVHVRLAWEDRPKAADTGDAHEADADKASDVNKTK